MNDPSKAPLLHKARHHLKKRLGNPSSPILFLNITQFLAALNDNLFKLFIVFLLIGALGKDQANSILSAAGAIFVIPFILFSASAGILADRFSKQRFIIVMKVIEILVTGLALVAFSLKSVWGCYSLLFALATHSALFGPPKYSIIPELVPPKAVPKANGIITSFTYIAIIVGTFLASFITEISNRNFIIAALFCLLIALIGFSASLRIPYTPSQGSTKKLTLFFIIDIYKTLRFATTREHLIYSIVGSAFFLFVGGFTQLNIIPFAIQSLHMSEVSGGYLFLSTAIGISIGAAVAGRLSRKKLNLGLSCMGGIMLSLSFFGLTIFIPNIFAVVTILIILGLSGGLFIVPFDSFTQLSSPDEKRGQVIGAANFLSFVGVFIAAISLYMIGDVLKLSAAEGFFVMGTLTLAFSLFLIFKLSDHVFEYLGRFLSVFYKIECSREEMKPAQYIIEDPSLFKTLALHRYLEKPIFLWMEKRKSKMFSLSTLCYSFDMFSSKKEFFYKGLSHPICFLGKKEDCLKYIEDQKTYLLTITKQKRKIFFARRLVKIEMKKV